MQIASVDIAPVPAGNQGSYLSLIKRVLVTLFITLMVVGCSLTIPSLIPYLIAVWVLLHTWLAFQDRPGSFPLLICFALLLLKQPAWIPSVLVTTLLLLVVGVARLPNISQRLGKPRWMWVCTLLLWVGTAVVWMQWEQMKWTSHRVRFDRYRPIACLGDSVTSGIIPDPGYPGALRSMVGVEVLNFGRSGMASDLGLEILPKALQAQPQIVVVELGGHDFLKGHSRQQTKANLLQIIRKSRAAGAEVVLLEIPRGFIIDPFSGLERELAYEEDVPLVSDAAIRQLVVWSPVCPPGMWFPESRLSDDGIHSNSMGSQALAKYVAAALRRTLGDQEKVVFRDNDGVPIP